MMADTLPRVAGKLTQDAPLAPLVWFKSGGAAEWLFEPRDLADLQSFLRGLDPAVPVMALGLGSNLIVRDGGVPGVVVRLGKAFAWVDTVGKDAFTIDDALDCGGGASGILVSVTGARSRHRRARIPPLDPGHGRRLRADERRGLWPRGQGCAGRLRRGAAHGRAGDFAGRRSALHLSPFQLARRRDRRRRAVPW